MNVLQRVLLLGTGPVAVQLAVLLKNEWNCQVGIVGRKSVRSASFFSAVKESGQRLIVHVQNEQHRRLAGECVLDYLFCGYQTVYGEWDTIVLSVTADAYIEVLQQLDEPILQQVRRVVLISPTFGSGGLVRQYLQERQSEAEVISFSTYLGDTRWLNGDPSHEVVTTGVKKKVFIGSTNLLSASVKILRELYERMGIVLEAKDSPLEAETRNISLYVHPPLFMNEFSLRVIFGEEQVPKYVYKMFPEGPITQHVIFDMLGLWQEITNVVEKLGMKGVNLLQFMTDDNYPVRLESLSRRDIENFPFFEPIRQAYLLYIRYTSLLVDPYSEPDQYGRYFDFSAVPIRTMFVNSEGSWDMPRMPKEDYYRIKMIRGIAAYVGAPCPTMDKLIATYEKKLEEAAALLAGESLSEAFRVQSFESDVQLVCRELEKVHH
ncbi:hypothetical protein AV540_15585 [Brevibacillus parabrevis]|uniref:opine metallophore biosynthesis dehydrogenase n=1 Tax=Brevibacillus parabrevis TaxID=54914 RepID=UPI0007AB2831|nr:opine metallophore biosynthesis dehydrogenase [Brevibacillus parabrevis]KZE49002.1 hypothetical protein AV540_15585 [Brevibacillus parabrevis]